MVQIHGWGQNKGTARAELQPRPVHTSRTLCLFHRVMRYSAQDETQGSYFPREQLKRRRVDAVRSGAGNLPIRSHTDTHSPVTRPCHYLSRSPLSAWSASLVLALSLYLTSQPCHFQSRRRFRSLSVGNTNTLATPTHTPTRIHSSAFCFFVFFFPPMYHSPFFFPPCPQSIAFY